MGSISVFRFVQLAAKLELYETAEMRKLAMRLMKTRTDNGAEMADKSSSLDAIKKDACLFLVELADPSEVSEEYA